MKTVFARTPTLKDCPTHYCPGCGHGIAHRLIAETRFFQLTVAQLKLLIAADCKSYHFQTMLITCNGRKPFERRALRLPGCRRVHLPGRPVVGAGRLNPLSVTGLVKEKWKVFLRCCRQSGYEIVNALVGGPEYGGNCAAFEKTGAFVMFCGYLTYGRKSLSNNHFRYVILSHSWSKVDGPKGVLLQV